MSASLFLKSLDKYKIPYLQNEIMSRHTSFCIGGNAEIFVIPENTEQLRLAVLCAKNENVPYFILGNGSNILVSDKGIRGAVICLSKLSEVRICGENTLYAGAGAKLLAVCAAARDASLSGLEFAYGIPGSVGGAVCMNAGAYGGEMKDVILKVEYLSKDGEIITAEKDGLDFGYRKSVFQTNGGIVSGAYFSLYPGDKSAIGEKMKQTMQKRVDKQPLDLPSAGSVFKRPEGNFAGAL
ncbi:MAG: UDP-N-acetylmuramate dehydrogenase, partial [Acutalibacteraceae bacterium]